MCLSENHKASVDWWESNKNKKYVTVYKVLELSYGKLEAGFRDYTYTQGEHIADTSLKPRHELSPKTSHRDIHIGLHAITTKRLTKKLWGVCDGEVLVPFRANPKDFIAANNEGCLVFRKLTLTEKAFNNALTG